MLVFVPNGNVFLSPGELGFSDGIRTSLSGNPRLVFWVFAIPTGGNLIDHPVIPRFPIHIDERLWVKLPSAIQPDALHECFHCKEMVLFCDLLVFGLRATVSLISISEAGKGVSNVQ
jgi:hypothetical protein